MGGEERKKEKEGCVQWLAVSHLFLFTIREWSRPEASPQNQSSWF